MFTFAKIIDYFLFDDFFPISSNEIIYNLPKGNKNYIKSTGFEIRKNIWHALQWLAIFYTVQIALGRYEDHKLHMKPAWICSRY